MAEWITVGFIALGSFGTLVTVLVKVSNALSRNTYAVDRLTTVMDKQEARLSDHEGRILVLEDRSMNRRASDRSED